MTPSLQGHILVASPKLTDPNFFRSVVLIIQHDEEGAVGLILNRRTPSTIRDVWELFGEGECDSDVALHLGGPVGNALLALHGVEEWSDAVVLPGLFVASEKDHLTQLVRQTQHAYRFFLGYSGWGAGQLDGELRSGGWLIATAIPAMAFYDGDDLWEQTVDRIGEQILRPAMGHVPSPDDPRVN